VLHFGDNAYDLVGAFWTTIQLTFLSVIGALILGTLLAAMRLSPVPMLAWLGTAYVNVVRNTPLTLILLFCSFWSRRGRWGSRWWTGIRRRRSTTATSGSRCWGVGLHGGIRVRDGAIGRQHRSARAGGGGAIAGLYVQPELANRAAATGLSFGVDPARFGADRVDEDTTIASAIGVGGGGVVDEGDGREPGRSAADQRYLRRRLRRPDVADGVVVRLARQTAGGGEMTGSSVLFDAPGPRALIRNRIISVGGGGPDAAGALGGVLEVRGQGSTDGREVGAVPHRQSVEDLSAAGHPGHP